MTNKRTAALTLVVAGLVLTGRAPAGSLESFPGVSERLAGEFGRLLQGATPALHGLSFFLPRRAPLFTKDDAGVRLSPIHPDSFGVPECVSVVLWVEKTNGNPDGSSLVFGLGQSTASHLAVLTDERGVPMVAMLERGGTNQFCRAESGGANVADGKRHSLAVVINLGSGLVRLYVDGRPEAARVFSFWRPELAGTAFALGPSGAPPIVIGRELEEAELEELKAGRLAASLREEPRLLEFAACLRKIRETR